MGLSYQAMTLMALYLLGLDMAIISAAILNKILRINKRSFSVVEAKL